MLSFPIQREPSLAVKKNLQALCFCTDFRYQIYTCPVPPLLSLFGAEVLKLWSQENVLKMHFLCPIDTETLGWDPAVCVFNKSSSWLLFFGSFYFLSFLSPHSSLPSFPLPPAPAEAFYNGRLPAPPGTLALRSGRERPLCC